MAEIDWEELRTRWKREIPPGLSCEEFLEAHSRLYQHTQFKRNAAKQLSDWTRYSNDEALSADSLWRQPLSMGAQVVAQYLLEFAWSKGNDRVTQFKYLLVHQGMRTKKTILLKFKELEESGYITNVVRMSEKVMCTLTAKTLNLKWAPIF